MLSHELGRAENQQHFSALLLHTLNRIIDSDSIFTKRHARKDFHGSAVSTAKGMSKTSPESRQCRHLLRDRSQLLPKSLWMLGIKSAPSVSLMAQKPCVGKRKVPFQLLSKLFSHPIVNAECSASLKTSRQQWSNSTPQQNKITLPFPVQYFCPQRTVEPAVLLISIILSHPHPQ